MVHDVADAHAEAAAVAEVVADDVAAVADDDDDVAHAELVAQQLDVALDQRHAVDLEHRLGHGPSVRVRAHAPSGGGDQANEM